MSQIFKMAFRDLGRNKRRSILSALAVSLGTALALFMAGILRGELGGAMQNTIRLQTGHLQIRSATYDENKVSLSWDDLVDNPDGIVNQLESQPQVVSATPRLIASGILSLGDKSKGVKLIGFDPASSGNSIYRDGVIAGEFLTPVDREGILVGEPLAEKFNLQVGDQVNLLVNTSDGSVDEQPFTIRGIYSTSTYVFDESTVFMPLAKAQSFARAENHATLIFIMLQNQDQAEPLAAALASSNYQVKTWQQMNELTVQFEQFAGAYMYIFYLIVFGITATVVTNTLVMAVYERTREIGILSAIGMKGRRIMSQFLAEAALLAIGGVAIGFILGAIVNGIVARIGLAIPSTQAVTGVLFSNRIRPEMTFSDVFGLTLAAFIITLFASLYPAALAARMEPVEALHAQ